MESQLRLSTDIHEEPEVPLLHDYVAYSLTAFS